MGLGTSLRTLVKVVVWTRVSKSISMLMYSLLKFKISESHLQDKCACGWGEMKICGLAYYVIVFSQLFIAALYTYTPWLSGFGNMMLLLFR